MAAASRFRFDDFVVSPRQRLLSKRGRPVPLIPRYFDLLLLLIVRRQDAVSKDVIFAEVWSDVIVSDGALSQAIRTLRRTLGDDPREPRFIRTVSRHGYQFVHAQIVEELDEPAAAAPRETEPAAKAVPVAPLVDRLLTATDPEEARDLAEQLHALGTTDALADLTRRPHHAPAVAIMRDVRWNVPNSGNVPLLTDTEASGAIVALIRLRMADVKGAIARRWASAAATGVLGGVVAGAIGGVALHFTAPETVPLEAAIALAAVGALAGGVGASGVAAGLVTAEAVARSRRTLALILCGGLGGAIVAGVTGIVLHAVLIGLFGLTLVRGGVAFDGLVLGAAAGLGYGLTTMPQGGGLAALRGKQRLVAAVAVAACTGVAAVGLALAGHPLVGGLVHEIARSSNNAELVLAPLGRLIGEPDFGTLTRAILSGFEGSAFGLSLGWGLTYRPKST